MRAINVFRPDAARATHAFDDVCASLQIPSSAVKAREMIAKRDADALPPRAGGNSCATMLRRLLRSICAWFQPCTSSACSPLLLSAMAGGSCCGLR